MKYVTIIDYGMGNIKSLFNCLKFLGYSPLFFSEQKSINSNICILPGVGAFNQAMKLIKDKQIYVQAGAGIVADSKPLNEFKETENKALAILTACKYADNLK